MNFSLNFRVIHFIKLAVVIIVMSAPMLVSCEKDESHLPMLNINYPAAYVVNGESNDISVIKLSDNTVTGTISLNGATFPHHIYLNPAKTKLAVAITSTDLSGGHAGHGGSMGGYKVQIIDVVTGMIDKEIPLSKMPHNAIFNISGSELWIGQMDDMQSKILVYSTSDWMLKNTISVGMGLSEVTFSKDGSMAFACNTMAGTVSVIDTDSKMVHTMITVGQDPVGAWGASNGNMYVDNETSQTVSEIDVTSMTVSATINLGFTPGYVAYHALNGELWVSDATHGKIEYYMFMAGTWSSMGSIATGANAHAISFTADGAKAYVTNQDAGTVSCIDVATHTVIKTIEVGDMPNGLAINN